MFRSNGIVCVYQTVWFVEINYYYVFICSGHRFEIVIMSSTVGGGILTQGWAFYFQFRGVHGRMKVFTPRKMNDRWPKNVK